MMGNNPGELEIFRVQSSNCKQEEQRTGESYEVGEHAP